MGRSWDPRILRVYHLPPSFGIPLRYSPRISYFRLMAQMWAQQLLSICCQFWADNFPPIKGATPISGNAITDHTSGSTLNGSLVSSSAQGTEDNQSTYDSIAMFLRCCIDDGVYSERLRPSRHMPEVTGGKIEKKEHKKKRKIQKTKANFKIVAWEVEDGSVVRVRCINWKLIWF